MVCATSKASDQPALMRSLIRAFASCSFIFFPDLGIHLDNGLFINRINPGSYAAKEGILTVGDRIVSVSKGIIQLFSVILLGETFSYTKNIKYSVIQVHLNSL